MGMTSGSSGGAMHDINVTPMIDVLLVLLIIFMTITPITPRGLEALVPQPPKDKSSTPPPETTIVIQVASHSGGVPSYKINETPVTKGDLEPRLQAIFATRANRVAFVKGDPDLNFADIAQVIDMAHAANVDHIGLITPKVEAGQ